MNCPTCLPDALGRFPIGWCGPDCARRTRRLAAIAAEREALAEFRRRHETVRAVAQLADAERGQRMSWQARAACRGHDPDLWFPTTRGIPAAAAALCRTCPVQDECAAFADRYATAGVWANRRLDDDRSAGDQLGLRGRRSA